MIFVTSGHMEIYSIITGNLTAPFLPFYGAAKDVGNFCWLMV